MFKSANDIVYSPTDLVAFLECEHTATLALLALNNPSPPSVVDESAALLFEKGASHERAYLEQLRASVPSFIDLSGIDGTQARLTATAAAMRDGVHIIYQGALQSGVLIGYPDFLRRVDRPSALGSHSYEVLDTKLARSAKGKFIVQLAAYTSCLAEAQGAVPEAMHVVLGNLRVLTYRCKDYERYVTELRRRFERRLLVESASSYPDPCDYCGSCGWLPACEERRVADDHLCQVANISKIQTRKLQTAGISTLKELGELDPETKIPKLHSETLARIRDQARLQLLARTQGERKVELLDSNDPTRGFARLLRPDPGDMFFDMEGNPYEDGGLEYLFGVYVLESGTPKFHPFWAHTRAEEKFAFENFMDFAAARLRQYPDAHIYHYAHYEPTALKRLMSTHGTRESDLDNLLRRRKFVDLYQVVREAIRVSEPSYSIKNIEHFYLDKRTTEVTNAGASIVYYERWKDSGDQKLLDDIEAYNLDDVRSTHKLRDWLVTLRPASIPWANAEESLDENPSVESELTEAERRLIPYRRTLVDPLPEDRSSWDADAYLRELTYLLLDFHRREAKPAYWKMFARQDMTEEELLDDVECLAGLRRVGTPVPDKRSLVWAYEYPVQETKLRTGSDVTLASSGEALGKLELDEETRRAFVRRTAKKGDLPDRIDLGPGRPISTSTITDALFRFADAMIAKSGAYPAAEALLRREMPRLVGEPPGQPIVPSESPTPQDIAEAIAKLDGSYLFIQGPPGAGKTYTGSHAIVELMRRGFRVGVTSNSHKAINNLLEAVERVAAREGFKFSGAKKSSEDGKLNGTCIVDVSDNETMETGDYQLLAGTAWLFTRPAFDRALDFMFIDEAGQVSLANTIAMATCAKNVVLLGDQMQLGQPIQGVHPGDSGQSSLEYLLEGQATISRDRGVFLGTTWRMHPDICGFISDAVYDSRLKPAPHTSAQILILGQDAHSELRPSGIRFIEAIHDACSQSSEEEASIVRDLVENLLTQRFRDKTGAEHPLTLENILIVAPYNVQVNLLERFLSEGARVGTVDKFQGQEAEVVIVSMTTSSGDYMPRFMDFLYSKNRLNVAISRARCLAVVIANPALLTIPCRSPEDMALVNTLCWVRDYARGAQEMGCA